jgi:hypothetical protein
MRHPKGPDIVLLGGEKVDGRDEKSPPPRKRKRGDLEWSRLRSRYATTRLPAWRWGSKPRASGESSASLRSGTPASDVRVKLSLNPEVFLMKER